jgi:hypothetical protein
MCHIRKKLEIESAALFPVTGGYRGIHSVMLAMSGQLDLYDWPRMKSAAVLPGFSIQKV